MSRHLDDADLPGLVMLGPTEPERIEAERHVATCEACRGSWRDTERAMALLDLDAPAPPRDLVARGVAVVSGAASAERSAFFAWVLAALACLGGLALAFAGLGPTLVPQPALKCIAVELVTGAAFFGGATLLARRASRALPPSVGGAAGALGAVAGEVYLHLACSEHGALHLFGAHAATVFAAFVLGTLAGRRLRGRTLATA